ncbi:MAG: 50S ribosomal protein L23 [candidate division SR1 bacterium]|nr:50S ribosomal protein L23 [candidate division SR1 bacterium]
MSQFKLVQTEKSYKVQENNFFMIYFVDKSFTPNKIEVAKILRKEGLNPLKVTVVNPYKKLKKRGKQNNIIEQKRYKKYFVKLKAGEKIEEENNNELV